MNKGNFNPGLILKKIDVCKKGRIFLAGFPMRAQSSRSFRSLQVLSLISKEIERLQDDEKYLKAMQEQTDAQEAPHQARQQRTQGE